MYNARRTYVWKHNTSYLICAYYIILVISNIESTVVRVDGCKCLSHRCSHHISYSLSLCVSITKYRTTATKNAGRGSCFCPLDLTLDSLGFCDGSCRRFSSCCFCYCFGVSFGDRFGNCYCRSGGTGAGCTTSWCTLNISRSLCICYCCSGCNCSSLCKGSRSSALLPIVGCSRNCVCNSFRYLRIAPARCGCRRRSNARNSIDLKCRHGYHNSNSKKD